MDPHARRVANSLLGLEVEVLPAPFLAGSVVIGLVLAVFALAALQATLPQALAFALLGLSLHWTLEFFHHVGHSIAARRTGYPMLGMVFGVFGIVARSVYPDDEPALPGRIHIRRALGGPILSGLIGLVLLALALLTGNGGLLNWLLWLGVLVSLLMSVGALMPIPNLDGATILYWARH